MRGKIYHKIAKTLNFYVMENMQLSESWGHNGDIHSYLLHYFRSVRHTNDVGSIFIFTLRISKYMHSNSEKERNKICNSSRSKQIPKTDQITEITPPVHNYF